MGDEMQQISKGLIEIKNARITSCEYEKPHYEIRASRATVRRKDKMTAWNVRIYALDKPIFWIPYLLIPLGQNNLPFNLSLGHNDEDGYYIEATKGVAISEHLQGKVLADWRSKRGFGAGGVLDYDYGKVARGNVIGYLTQDENAPDVTQSDPFFQRVDRNRGRFTWRHRADLDPYSFLVGRYHDMTDEYVLQDFFEKEFRSEIEQSTFVTLTKNTEHWGSMIHVQKRLNDFERTVERLPEVRFDWKNQPFFHPNLYYENQISIANLSKRFGRSLTREDVFRTDNVHQWFLPMNWGQIKWTPYGFLRGTHYSRERFDTDDEFRFTAGYGFDLRTQFYRTYDVTADVMGVEINKLRHVFEPVFRFDSVPLNTLSNERLHQFDSIDAIDNQHVFTIGMENRIQTKRVVDGKMKRVDIVSLNTFLNYSLNADEPSSASAFKSLDQEIVLRPYQWLQYETRMRFSMEETELESLNQDLIIRREPFRFLMGHRYVRDPRVFQAGFTTDRLDTSHQFVFEGEWQVNDLWTLHGHVRFDADEMELEEWQVGATRDLHDFILDFGYNVRNSARTPGNNNEVYFNFAMKQFPLFNLRSGQGRATFADPRIGETVAGANQYGGRQHYFEEPVATVSY